MIKLSVCPVRRYRFALAGDNGQWLNIRFKMIIFCPFLNNNNSVSDFLIRMKQRPHFCHNGSSSEAKNRNRIDLINDKRFKFYWDCLIVEWEKSPKLWILTDSKSVKCAQCALIPLGRRPEARSTVCTEMQENMDPRRQLNPQLKLHCLSSFCYWSLIIVSVRGGSVNDPFVEFPESGFEPLQCITRAVWIVNRCTFLTVAMAIARANGRVYHGQQIMGHSLGEKMT